MSKRNSKKHAQQIAELEVKKRSGLVRMIFAIVFFAALIVVKTTLVSNGVEWANYTFVNGAFFALALVFAWMLNPAVRWLEGKSSGSRKVISMILIVMVFAVIGGALFGLSWMAVDQIRSLFDNRQSLLDELLNGVVNVINSVGGWLEGMGDFVPQGFITTSEDLIDALLDWVQGLDFSGWLTQMAGQAPSMVTNVSGFAVALIVFMMASYFITGDYPRLRQEFTDRVPMMARDFCRS